MEDYLIHTKNSFDQIADTFDEEDRSNEILQWMRDTVYEIYLRDFKKGDRLLELNAGTGIDAVFLSRKGLKIFATDISDNMIDILNEKITLQGLGNKVQAKKLSFNEIVNLNEKDFDGIISNFGGLNCINNFSNLSESLAAKVKPGGKFVASVMNSICPWEILYFLLKFDAENAFRRFNKAGIDANLSKFKIKSFYFTPKEFAKHFKKYFTVKKIYSLGLFTPSPYLHGIYKKIPGIVNVFMEIDNLIKGTFPFNRFGDHFVIVLERKSFSG